MQKKSLATIDLQIFNQVFLMQFFKDFPIFEEAFLRTI